MELHNVDLFIQTDLSRYNMYTIVHLSGGEDEPLVRRLYDALCANFGEDELDEYPILLEELRGEDARMDLICHVALGPAADTGERAVMGGVIWEYFRASRCMLFTYLLIEPDARGKGLGLQLSIASWRAALEFEKQRGETFRAIFVEMHDPRLAHDDAAAGSSDGEGVERVVDAIDPLERVRTFQHMGVRKVSEFHYMMPALREGLASLPYLLGVVITPRTPRHEGQLFVPTEVVQDFVADFYEDSFGLGFEANCDFQAMMASLADRERVALVDFDLTPPPAPLSSSGGDSASSPSSASASAAAGATAATAASGAGAAPLAPGATSVVIVGAGVAGLACAQALNLHRATNGDRLFDVTVIEARTRIGGRVYTARTEDARIDLGASWLHGIHGNCAADILAAAAVEGSAEDALLCTDWLALELFGADGSTLPLDRLFESAMRFEQFKEVYRARVEALAPASAEVSAAEALAALYADEPQLRCRDDVERAVWNFLLSRDESENNASMREMSALDAFDESGELEGGDHLRKGGMRALPMLLSEGVHVVLSTELTEVVARNGGAGECTFMYRYILRESCSQFDSRPLTSLLTEGVDVHCTTHSARGATRGVHACDVVVLTLPIGVLQHGAVRFTPALPWQKRGAIARIGNGLFNKVVLRFPSNAPPFWNRHTHAFGFNHAIPGDAAAPPRLAADTAALHANRRNLWFVNYMPLCGAPVLVALISASLAREMQAMADGAVIERVLAALRVMFGRDRVPAPTDTKVSRWGNDEWSRGSYSFLKQGSSLEDFDALAAPVCGERVLFAGEATSRTRWGYMDGAIDSGRREARRIIARRGGGARL